MLIEFRVENHRSLRDEQGITFEASGDRKDERLRHIGKHHLLPVAAIYGANASGKSNVLSALQWMRQSVVHSFLTWAPGTGVPRQPFAWGEARQRPSTFEAAFLIDGVHHTYGFVVDDQVVLEEWLWVRPHGRKQVWFERKGQDFTIGEHLKGENEVIQAVTRPNAMFLSVAAHMNHPQLTAVHAFFRCMDFASHASDLGTEASFVLARLTSDAELLRGLVVLLRSADTGIEEIRIRGSRVELRHRSDAADPAWLPLSEESHGTQRLFWLGPTLIRLQLEGGILIIDEIESGLHPLLVRTMLEMFQTPRLNPRNAQLIFTTHDTLLLGTMLDEVPPLRRDQVWLAEKDEAGVSDIVPLTVYKVRKGDNLERGYLQGRYRGTPIINRSRFWRFG